MKLVFFIGLAIMGLSAAEQYTDKYDDMNIDDIIANKRLLISYLKCVLDQGRCTPEGKEIKLHIKDAMQTGCAKCTETQRKNARKVVSHVRENEKTYFEELKKKYDPKDEYKEIYEAFLKSHD